MNASTNHPARESAARIVAIDLAKDVFELAFADREHRIVARKRLDRTHSAAREAVPKLSWLHHANNGMRRALVHDPVAQWFN